MVDLHPEEVLPDVNDLLLGARGQRHQIIDGLNEVLLSVGQ